MASWIVHLRIADILADEFNVDLTKFIIGNLAPDSGEILSDGTYSPSADVTHWKTSKKNHLIQPDDFYRAYLATCKTDNRSFYLGYFSHLVTDYYWHQKLLELYYENNWERHDDKCRHLIYSLNYNIDRIYLKKHPEIRALKILKNTYEFKNTYLDYFSENAIISKIKDIYKVYNTGFLPEDENEYVSSEMIDLFISNTVEIIRRKIRAFNDDSFVSSTQAWC